MSQLLLASPIPERQPAILTLVYGGGLLLVLLLLSLSLLRTRRMNLSALANIAPRDLPDEVRSRLASASTNVALAALRWLFFLAAIGTFGFHVYWAHYAAATNETFQQLGYKDLRNRRLEETTLRGWILDRTGDLDRALALYRMNNGQMERYYPLDSAVAHLMGSDRGDPGLERALFGLESDETPEALDLALNRDIIQHGNRDVRLTIDGELQKTAVEQLHGRRGAVVVLNPQSGDILAMYSNPSYSIREVQDEVNWIKLQADKRDNPLVNRALSAFYIPGSTFKTVTMTAAFLSGLQGQQFTCSSSGFVASPGAKPIFDDGGPGEVHGHIGIDIGFEASCNQFFSQMGVKLGPQRMKAAAQLLGIGAYDNPQDAVLGRKRPDIWNASSAAVARALAPRESAIVTNPNIRPYDLALEGYGQGYAGQMTPFQMALVVSAIGNLQGRLMKPKIEYDLSPAVYRQVNSAQNAAEMRRIMGLVVSGPQGTGRAVFGPVLSAGITAGGKTGTAQKEVPVYDDRTGEPVKIKKIERDRNGRIIGEHEVDEISPEKRIDSWFLCLAPLENPQIAMAVIIEGGGYGSKAAAPVAAALVLKARDLGLLGDIPQVDQAKQRAPVSKRLHGKTL